MLPQPMMPRVLAYSSTPMKRFFSHFPAWVETSAAPICRAAANNRAMACSAVVIELPNGVFMTTIPRAVAAGMSMLSTPMPARPITLRFLRGGDDVLVGFGGGAHRQAVVAADDLQQIGLLQPDVDIHFHTAAAKDLERPRAQLIGNENFGHGGLPYPAISNCARQLAKAQSSQGVRACRSLCSTVAPHQMRKPGGAER